jgi:hypothetical protein
MRARLTILVCLALASVNVAAKAAPPLSCTPDLFKDYSKGTYNDAATLAMLDVVDQSNFETFKQNFGANITVPIQGVPVDFGGTWDSFRDTRSRVFAEHQYSSSSSKSLQWLNIYFSAAGGTAYDKCLDAYIKSTAGVHVWAKDVSATGATLYVEWVTPPGLGAGSVTIHAEGAPDWQDLDVNLIPNASANFTIKRNSDKEVRITVNTGGAYADNLTIPPDPKIAIPPQIVAEPKIVEIATPAGGSDADSHPVRENTWEVRFPITDSNHVGIGFVVEPDPFPFHRNWVQGADFTMHDHHGTPGVPDKTRAVITYRFDKPVRVVDVLMIQHANGITQIEGFVGNSEGGMESIGKAASILVGANPPIQNGRFPDGARDVFSFPQTRAGTLFRMIITHTSGPSGYAMYRAYPRDSNHKEFEVLTAQ